MVLGAISLAEAWRVLGRRRRGLHPREQANAVPEVNYGVVLWRKVRVWWDVPGPHQGVRLAKNWVFYRRETAWHLVEKKGTIRE